jgi:beta-N-acetylhexosaminidase
MTLERQCARMLMVGFPGPTLDDGLRRLLRQGVFGAILFKRNVGKVAETSELCRALKAAAPGPLVLGVDQEGGRVARLRGSPFTALPPMRELGRRGDAALARRVGQLLAFELRAVGFDWDFAPVLDVDTNPQNPVIGDRAFHHSPGPVGTLGVALAQGLEEGGVASCGKHFPGHGDTVQDSHHVLPRLPHALDRLRAVELAPFVEYARAGLAALMTAHVVFEAVDPTLPATLSPRVMEEILRREVGFQGVAVSDDLEMKAVADHYPIGEAAVLGALAGVDLFLVCHREERQAEAISALVHAVESGRLPRARVEQAQARLDALATRFAHPADAERPVLGSAEHRALARGLTAHTSGADPTESTA